MSNINSLGEVIDGTQVEAFELCEGSSVVEDKVGNVVRETDNILDDDSRFTRLTIEINGEEKEIFLCKTNLKVDSTQWEEKVNFDNVVKLNPEGDIVEYVSNEDGEIEDFDLVGEQLFITRSAAIREAEKQGLRLLNFDEVTAIYNKYGTQFFVDKMPGLYLCGMIIQPGSHLAIRTIDMKHDKENNTVKVGVTEITEGFIRNCFSSSDHGISVRCVKK